MNTLDLLLERLIHELVLLDEGEALECRTCYLDVVEGSAAASSMISPFPSSHTTTTHTRRVLHRQMRGGEPLLQLVGDELLPFAQPRPRCCLPA